MGPVWKAKQEVLGGINDRQIAGLRVLLSVGALLAIYLDPDEPSRFVALTDAALIFYTLYSASVYVFSRRVGTFSIRSMSLLVWTDVVLYGLLISLCDGTNTIFSRFYFFTILVACSRLGPNEGIAVTAVSVLLSVVMGYFATLGGVADWQWLSLRPASLIAGGYVLVCWARAEQDLKRKLELLREVSRTFNPRFGVDRTEAHFMECVLKFFDADTCIFWEYDCKTHRQQLRCATARDPKAGSRVITVPGDIQRILADMSNASVSVYTEPAHLWRKSHTPAYQVWDPNTQITSCPRPESATALNEWLGGRSFIMAPLRHHEWFTGYLFVGATRPNSFRIHDAKFLLQLADQVTPVLEHIRLVDRMASDSADEERRRIARSVHDRVIQPYIGLQMGLIGVRRLAQSIVEDKGDQRTTEGFRQAMAALDRLVDMTRGGVEELKRYVYGLRDTSTQREVLIESLIRYAVKFETVTGIHVRVLDLIDFVEINDRLAGEIFEMATEALSNVQRHTSATAATLTIECKSNGSVTVGIENEGAVHSEKCDFLPRSISERAESLGGHAEVSNDNGRTVVRVDIPL